MINDYSLKPDKNINNIICDPRLQKNVPSIQASNVEQSISQLFLRSYSTSPYAVSISFMKNITLLGYDDDLGQSKFDLNLDESSLLKFYQNLHFQTIHESHDETRD